MQNMLQRKPAHVWVQAFWSWCGTLEELHALANENTGRSVTREFQTNDNFCFVFTISVYQILHKSYFFLTRHTYFAKTVMYHRLQFGWSSCIFCGNPKCSPSLSWCLELPASLCHDKLKMSSRKKQSISPLLHRRSPLPGPLELLLSQEGNLYIWPLRWCARWRFVNQLNQDVIDKCIYTYIPCIYDAIYIYTHTHTSNRKYSFRCMSLWVWWMYVYIYITITQVTIQTVFTPQKVALYPLQSVPTPRSAPGNTSLLLSL